MDDEELDDDGIEAGVGSASVDDGTDIATYLGSPLPASEAAMWAAMSGDRRAKAIRRMDALGKWKNGEGEVSAAGAAALAGVSLNRFWEMAKAWRENRSLGALGTFARTSRRLDPREASLRLIVNQVLGPWPTGSVRQMAIDLGNRFEATGGKPVGQSMLRRVVEEELRRRETERQLGNEIRFDCSACSVLRPDGSPYVLYAVLDRGSQMVLGGSLGEAADSAAGYAGASRDALRRLGDSTMRDLPWVARIARMELVAGLDAERWVGLRERMRAAGVRPPVEPSTRPKRFGRYLRPAIGDRLGQIDMWYGRTIPDENRDAKVADRSLRLERDDAIAFLAAQIDDHNRTRRALLAEESGTSCPDDLIHALGILAG